MSLERGPLSLVSTIEELLGRKSSSSCLKSREYGRMGSVSLTTWHLLSEKLALTSSTSGGRSIDRGVKPWIFFFTIRNCALYSTPICHYPKWLCCDHCLVPYWTHFGRDSAKLTCYIYTPITIIWSF
jgi:hypothetical protein